MASDETLRAAVDAAASDAAAAGPVTTLAPGARPGMNMRCERCCCRGPGGGRWRAGARRPPGPSAAAAAADAARSARWAAAARLSLQPV